MVAQNMNKNTQVKWELSDRLVRYLAHVRLGLSIRALADYDHLAPSTVSRQFQKIEKCRDDRFYDCFLNKLENSLIDPNQGHVPENRREIENMIHERQIKKISNAKLEAEARRVLRRMSERNAFLLLSSELDNAAVFRQEKDGSLHRLTVTGRAAAEEFLLRDWIEGKTENKVARYMITSRGKNALKRLVHREQALKETEEFAEMQSAFTAQHAEYVDKDIYDKGISKRYRVNVAESPLAILARKKDKTGQPYLTSRQVAAGERLREDFEVAQIGPNVTQNWDRFLTAASRGQFNEATGGNHGAEEAKMRLNKALADLGDGLADIAFRCCCYLEGLETIEKKLGWSARSGKVVLRIALERLTEFYNIPDRRRDH